MLPLILMGVEEMLLFDTSVLKMYLLNTHKEIHINLLTFNYFIFFYLSHKNNLSKCMINRLIHDIFHITPAITQIDMEKVKY
jgi:hypothetical protein